MDLAELLGRSLQETLTTVDHDELFLWIARAERQAKQQGGRRLPLKGR